MDFLDSPAKAFEDGRHAFAALLDVAPTREVLICNLRVWKSASVDGDLEGGRLYLRWKGVFFRRAVRALNETGEEILHDEPRRLDFLLRFVVDSHWYLESQTSFEPRRLRVPSTSALAGKTALTPVVKEQFIVEELAKL